MVCSEIPNQTLREVRTMKRSDKGMLRCDVCKQPIEELTPEQADEDMDGHGWSDHKTAQQHGCYHCQIRFPQFGIPFNYETYFAGRYEDLPDGTRKVFVGQGTCFIREKK